MSASLPEVLPVFPLPGLVLFPGAQMPLHIFEPRYREMLEMALTGDRMIVMALLQPGWEEEYYGNPAIHTVGCIGRIMAAQKLSDGRSYITLTGGTRVHVETELPGLPFRRARVRPLPDHRDWLASPEAAQAVPALLQLFRKIHEDPRVAPGPNWKPEPDSLEVAVNSMAMLFPGEPQLRQQLLEFDDVEQRFRRLEGLVREVLTRRDLLGRWKATKPDDPEMN